MSGIDSDNQSMDESISNTIDGQDISNAEDGFKILLATDIHLGYKEDDAIRGEDTFQTFEEILKIGAEAKVDFILLGGDLFHDTRPSPYCINKCITLLRKYCLGDNPITFEIISDQEQNFQRTINHAANFEDPNLNVGIPVFSIHGNHDDPTGKNRISAVDLMSSTGLINYFGRWEDLTRVDISPILLKKNNNFLALYGLSHISDQRLGRLFLNKQVSFLKPESNEVFFNLLVLHQNRVARGPKNFIPPDAIPKNMNLVMWGHEHDCHIAAEQVGSIYITQPGSSVATSLVEGESLTKKVGILKTAKRGNKYQFKIDEYELHTVRPFIFENIILDFPNVPLDEQLEKSKRRIRNHIESMIAKAAELNRIPQGVLPLIRLRAHYKHEKQIFNAIKFGQQFVGKVANPEDILKFIVLSGAKIKQSNFRNLDEDAQAHVNARRVEDIIGKFFEDHKNEMSVLSVKGLTSAVMKYIDTNDSDAPKDIINHQFQKTLDKLKEWNPEEDEIDGCLARLRDIRSRQDEDIEVKNILDNPDRKRTATTTDDVDSIMIDDDSDSDITNIQPVAPTRPARGPGSRGGRGSRSRSGSRGRGRASAL